MQLIRALGFLAIAWCTVHAVLGDDEEEDILRRAEGSPGSNYVNNLLVDIENDADKNIDRLVRYLRSKDFRMVRIGISAEAKGKQRLFGLAEGLPAILRLLAKSRPLSTRRKAAEAIHLIAAENHDMAQMVGLQAWLPNTHGLPDLISMVNSTATESPANEEAILSAEEALEALWTLTRTSVDNVEMAIEKDAVHVLVKVLLSEFSARCTMWAAITLKRLLADQYNTPDGSYSSTGRVIINNANLRSEVIAMDGLIEKLIRIVKNERVTETLPRSEWPRHAELSHRTNPSIKAWAAAGLLSTLAMNGESHKLIREYEGVDALCILKDSPDSLEEFEAKGALQSLDEVCSKQAEL